MKERKGVIHIFTKTGTIIMGSILVVAFGSIVATQVVINQELATLKAEVALRPTVIPAPTVTVVTPTTVPVASPTATFKTIRPLTK